MTDLSLHDTQTVIFPFPLDYHTINYQTPIEKQYNKTEATT